MSRTVVERALATARGAVDVPTLVDRSLLGVHGDRVFVAAIGKAAPRMAEGAWKRLGDRLRHAVVVAPDDVDVSFLAESRRIELIRAAHPLPDRRSVEAGRRLLSLARTKWASDLVVLLSGGASSLVCAPAPGLDVATKRAVVRAMLRSGAPIADVNVVRKHMSLVKGGGLLRAAYPKPVVTRIVSDVIAGSADVVGSGPSVPDPSTPEVARHLLRIHAPRYADLPLVDTLDPSAIEARASDVRILATPESFARAVARALRDRGIRARTLRASEKDVEILAAQYLRAAASLPPGTAIVRAAEPRVRVLARGGHGGRACHLAALVARDLPRGLTFAAVATDGVDGSSGTGGAVVDSSLLSRAGRARIEDALRRFDTGPLHIQCETALPLRPSGENFADVHVLVRRRD